jgi:hypothetical protein
MLWRILIDVKMLHCFSIDCHQEVITLMVFLWPKHATRRLFMGIFMVVFLLLKVFVLAAARGTVGKSRSIESLWRPSALPVSCKSLVFSTLCQTRLSGLFETFKSIVNRSTARTLDFVASLRQSLQCVKQSAWNLANCIILVGRMDMCKVVSCIKPVGTDWIYRFITKHVK